MVYSGSTWQTGSWYMVHLDIPQISRFGGDYAYTGSGIIFTKSISQFPINPTLLEGNGKFSVSLTQYTLEGEIIASGNYTSADCTNLTGYLPGFWSV